MNDNAHRYDFARIESRWQARWECDPAFATPNPGDAAFDAKRPKFYVLDMFPYTSGVGLHVGHPLGYIATDIVARYKRMNGFNVLHPMGFDAFGLPAEQYAVEHGVHPRVTTEQNIENMLRQLKVLGLSYDWQRQFATADVGYYKWTQWIFLQLFHSYFDPLEQRAMPMTHLIERLEGEDYLIAFDGSLVASGISEDLDALGGPMVGPRKWYELTDDERRGLLDSQRLAYLAEVPVNWCPALGTVLANEEVTNEGRSERGNHPVFKRPLEQWMLRITAYADRLIDDLDQVDWPEPVKRMQRHWVGRSEGAMIDFAVDGGDEVIRVFTTRPDTLFGATYMVLAPEHPLVDELADSAVRDVVGKYRAQAAARSDVDRMAETKDKTGLFIGAYAINPVNGKRIPIWIADYVMMGYGTGAIMAVPAHDERDYEFARTFDLPIVEVVAGGDVREQAYTGQGVAIHSANEQVSLDGLPTPQAKAKMTEWLESKGLGKLQIQYKLRDWLFSRQRYWGEPFPILHGPNGEIMAVDEGELPVELPKMEDFTPAASDDATAPPHPPLARAPEHWRWVEKDGVTWERELNTMPQWAGSCWYYLRFCDPHNDETFVDAEAERYWMNPAEPRQSTGDRRELAQAPMGVDLYVGGVEHAVLHLLYARFWHKVLYDLGHVSTPEPFGRLFNQGYIQAYAYLDERGVYVSATEVVNAEGKPASEVQGQPGEKFFHEGQPVREVYGKMGKSLKNAVAPDDVCKQYGADTLRLYEMYMGPLDASKPWATRDIIGVHRFCQRVWRNFVDERTGEMRIRHDRPDEAMLRLVNRTIKRVTDDMERLSLNTAIAALIEMNNELTGRESISLTIAEPFVLLLAPFAPHLAEELWQRLGHEDLIARADWPGYDEGYLTEDQVEIVVQVLGKVRSRITVAADADEKTIERAALAEQKIASLIEGKTVRKVIVVPGKLVNIVAN